MRPDEAFRGSFTLTRASVADPQPAVAAVHVACHRPPESRGNEITFPARACLRAFSISASVSATAPLPSSIAATIARSRSTSEGSGFWAPMGADTLSGEGAGSIASVADFSVDRVSASASDGADLAGFDPRRLHLVTRFPESRARARVARAVAPTSPSRCPTQSQRCRLAPGGR